MDQNNRVFKTAKIQSWGFCGGRARITYPFTALLANLARANTYNPDSDAASIYADEEAMTEHSLGHAIDYARMGARGEGGGVTGYVGRIPKKLLRDIYRYRVNFLL